MCILFISIMYLNIFLVFECTKAKKKKIIVSQALPHLFQMPLICLFFRLE